MPATYADRLNGLTTSVAVKPPCRVATAANITLSGLQTIDSVALATDDRVLVRAQTDATQNGIWNAASGAWTRAKDFDGSLDAVGGTTVSVVSGTSYARSNWRVVGTGPIAIGTASITFAMALFSDADLALESREARDAAIVAQAGANTARIAAETAEANAELARDAAVAGASSAGYRPTIAEAITDFTVGQFFTSDDQGEVTTHPNELRLYERIVGSPFYLDQGDEASPVGRAFLGKAETPEKIGTAPRGIDAPAIVASLQDRLRAGLDLMEWEKDKAESGRFTPEHDGSDAVEAWAYAGLELCTMQGVGSPGWDANFTTRPLAQVEMRINGTGGLNNDGLNHIVIARDMPYLANGARYRGSPDSVITSGADGLQLFHTIDGVLAQTVFQTDDLQPYGCHDISFEHLTFQLGDTASEAFFLQTLANANFHNCRVWGGRGAAWTMTATSAGGEVLAVTSASDIKVGHVMYIGGLNLPDGQPRRFMVRAINLAGTELTLDKSVPAGTYTITHTTHGLVGQMLQQSTINGLVFIGTENAAYFGRNAQGFGCTDNKIKDLMSDYCGGGPYEAQGNNINRWAFSSLQYATERSDLTIDGAIGIQIFGCWSEVTERHDDNPGVPSISAFNSTIGIYGWNHAHNGLFKRLIWAKDCDIELTGFQTTNGDLPVNPSVANDIALAVVDGGTFHADWGGNMTNVIGGVSVLDTPEKLVVTPGGSNTAFGISSTAGKPWRKTTTRAIRYRAGATTAVIETQEPGKPEVGMALTGGRLYANDGTVAPDKYFYIDSGVWDTNAGFNTTEEYRVDGLRVLGPRQDFIADPAGGSVVDTECRTATQSILDLLAAHGLMDPTA